MDVYIEHSVKVNFTLDKDEILALGDLIRLASEYAGKEGFNLSVDQAKVYGHIHNTTEQVRRLA